MYKMKQVGGNCSRGGGSGENPHRHWTLVWDRDALWCSEIPFQLTSCLEGLLLKLLLDGSCRAMVRVKAQKPPLSWVPSCKARTPPATPWLS